MGQVYSIKPMDLTKPVTQEEALQYDRDSIAREVQRREKNLPILFVNEVDQNRERAEITRLYKILAIIDAQKT